MLNPNCCDSNSNQWEPCRPSGSQRRKNIETSEIWQEQHWYPKAEETDLGCAAGFAMACLLVDGSKALVGLGTTRLTVKKLLVASMLLVVRSGAPSSVLAPSSDARSP